MEYGHGGKSGRSMFTSETLQGGLKGEITFA